MKRELPIEWQCHPEAEHFLREASNQFISHSTFLQDLKTMLLIRTSTRLFDWVDHLVFSDGPGLSDRLHQIGYEALEETTADRSRIFLHLGSILPPVLVKPSVKNSEPELLSMALSVEDLISFLKALNLPAEIAGTPFSPLRVATVWEEGQRSLKVLERRAFEGFEPREMPADYADFLLRLYESWYSRQRVFDNLNEGVKYTLQLAKAMVKDSDRDTAAWAAFYAERNYWQLRNRAGRIQKMRQDTLGLGWANHDHHTFRSSREAFPALLKILQTFGFQLREKFYAGSEAGWGAQVLEQPTCHLVVFADVDLKAEELALDFEKVSLKSFPEKGTVGLWCALHGESILQAGLHHLAARFSFKELQKDLERDRVLMLPPFSEFEFLKQAFTQGERWKIPQERLKEIKKDEVIDERQFSAYRDEGVIGSHMENIQRDEGFKGFNQESVSDIIRRTDPRLDFGAA